MNTIKNSWFFQFFSMLIDKIQNIISNSAIYKVFTKDCKQKDAESLFSKILYKIIDFLRFIFNALKLNIVFKDSIFAKTYIWVGLTVALASILSTMQMLLLVLFSSVSFIIKICMEPDFKFKYTPLNAWIVLFIIMYGVSGVVSLDASSSIKIAMLVISFILFYFVTINSITTEKQLKSIIKIFSIIAGVVSLYGIYQYIFGGTFASSSFLDKEMFEDIKTRVYGTFDNPNVLGEYLLLAIPIVASNFLAEKNWFKKIFYIGIEVLCLIALALTYSRGCYLGIVLGIAVFVLLIDFRWIIGFILGILALPALMPHSIINRFTSIGDMEDGSTSYRVSIWRGTIDMIKDYWYRPIGQGTTAFNSIYPLYSFSGVGAQHTHNLFLQLTIETGIVGIILFIGIIFKFFQSLLSAISKVKDNAYRFYMIGFVSGMSGFVLQSLFDNTWYNNKIILIFWIYIALALITKNLSSAEVSSEEN